MPEVARTGLDPVRQPFSAVWALTAVPLRRDVEERFSLGAYARTLASALVGRLPAGFLPALWHAATPHRTTGSA